jgi:ABC-type bacteriocin/lantibiotic exporter with double-glycine peptidase domain
MGVPARCGRAGGGAAVLALAALAGCRATPRAEVLSSEAVVLPVPAVAQDELYECGLAALSALSAFWGIELDARERAELVRAAEEHEGLSGDELRAALEDEGLEVFLFEGTLGHATTGLYHHVDRGRPAIVMISTDGESHHYGLVSGYDPRRSLVVLQDPRRGVLVLPAETFDRLWGRSRRFMLLAVPREPGAAESAGARASAATPDEASSVPAVNP